MLHQYFLCLIMAIQVMKNKDAKQTHTHHPQLYCHKLALCLGPNGGKLVFASLASPNWLELNFAQTISLRRNLWSTSSYQCQKTKVRCSLKCVIQHMISSILSEYYILNCYWSVLVFVYFHSRGFSFQFAGSLNCASFVAGIVESALHGCNFVSVIVTLGID